MICSQCGGELDDFGPHLCADLDIDLVVKLEQARRARAPPISMRDKAAARWGDRLPVDQTIAALSKQARAALAAAAGGAPIPPGVARTLAGRGLVELSGPRIPGRWDFSGGGRRLLPPPPVPAALTIAGREVENRLKARNDSAIRAIGASAGGE